MFQHRWLAAVGSWARPADLRGRHIPREVAQQRHLGKALTFTGVPVACKIVSAGAVLSVPILMRWKLQTAATLDLMPSTYWPEPVVSSKIDSDQGPP
jgi:hypothetical protein